ncbi:MAG: hypothetical protein WC747_00285 [Candidatus Babeliales bacterium]|jgi:hypothetical protein
MTISAEPDNNGFSKNTYAKCGYLIGLLSGLDANNTRHAVADALRHANKGMVVRCLVVPLIQATIFGYVGYNLGYDVGSVVENAKKQNQNN